MFPRKLIQNVTNTAVITYNKCNAGKRFVLTQSLIQWRYCLEYVHVYMIIIDDIFCLISSKSSIARLQDFAPNTKVISIV